MSSDTYHYAIIGAGASGLQLALALAEDPFFAHKRILIIDKEAKTRNDKTWCFWEVGSGKWDQLIQHSWKDGLFYGRSHKTQLKLDPYCYKMLRSVDFYNYASNKIRALPNFHWIKEEVQQLETTAKVQIKTDTSTYEAELIFDSRMTDDWKNDKKSLQLYQHFRGWKIKSKQPIFDPSSFTMMDYRLSFKDSCSFTYVLPLSETEALIEHTFFTPTLAGKESYDKLLAGYIKDILGIKKYTIEEIEEGVIPMTNYNFSKHHQPKIIKIGTAAGWVKPSTGYSFSNAGKEVARMIHSLKNGNDLTAYRKKRFRWYDNTILDVLQNKNSLGPQLFAALYTGNPTPRLLRFLDEETTFKEELLLMATVNPIVFGKAFFRQFIN
jgi:lycopene beta-cyclase